MRKAKIAVTIDAGLLERVDRMVEQELFPNRSRAVEAALVEKLERIRHTRLAQECAKLDPVEERALAEEGLQADQETWPEY
jgi:metal-responsive CopG/Arc/MetJ family transcriptional regulator